MTSQPPASGASGLVPSHGTETDALRRDERRYAPEGIALGVVPQPQAMGRDAPARLDMGCFGEHEPGAADGARAEVDQMPVLGHAVVGRVLAHGRDHDPVAQSDRAERDRLEQMRVGIAPHDTAPGFGGALGHGRNSSADIA